MITAVPVDNWTTDATEYRRLPRMDRTRSPFSRAEAVRAGINVTQLSGPDFRRLFRGIYVAADATADVKLRARAAIRLAVPDGFASHHTAALIYGAVPPHSPDVHISRSQKNKRSVKRGLMVHLASASAATTRFAGIPISTPEQCFLDIAASGATLVDLVILGDSLVKKKRTTPDELVAAADQWHGYRARLARRAAGFVRAGVDSPMESRLRMLIVLAGLPEPTVNLIIWTVDGRFELRFDLFYDAYKLVVEYDGRQHYEDEAQRRRDVLRREELDRRGIRMIVVMADDIYREPLATLARIRTALIDRGAKGLRTTFRDEWSQHFPAMS